MMAFRLKPRQSKTYYFAANTYISKSKAEDNTSSILMNSIGIGTVRSKNYIVEVGFLKLPRTGYTKEAMKKPDGLIFILRSIF